MAGLYSNNAPSAIDVGSAGKRQWEREQQAGIQRQRFLGREMRKARQSGNIERYLQLESLGMRDSNIVDRDESYENAAGWVEKRRGLGSEFVSGGNPQSTGMGGGSSSGGDGSPPMSFADQERAARERSNASGAFGDRSAIVTKSLAEQRRDFADTAGSAIGLADSAEDQDRVRSQAYTKGRQLGLNDDQIAAALDGEKDLTPTGIIERAKKDYDEKFGASDKAIKDITADLPADQQELFKNMPPELRKEMAEKLAAKREVTKERLKSRNKELDSAVDRAFEIKGKNEILKEDLSNELRDLSQKMGVELTETKWLNKAPTGVATEKDLIKNAFERPDLSVERANDLFGPDGSQFVGPRLSELDDFFANENLPSFLKKDEKPKEGPSRSSSPNAKSTGFQDQGKGFVGSVMSDIGSAFSGLRGYMKESGEKSKERKSDLAMKELGVLDKAVRVAKEKPAMSSTQTGAYFSRGEIFARESDAYRKRSEILDRHMKGEIDVSGWFEKDPKLKEMYLERKGASESQRSITVDISALEGSLVPDTGSFDRMARGFV